MKKTLILLLIFFTLNIFAADNIFMCFSGLNTFLKEQYKIETPDNQYNINQLVSFGYERIGLKVDVSNSDIKVYDNYAKEYSYSFKNKTIIDEFIEYLKDKWLPENSVNPVSFDIKGCNIEKVDSNSCGIFGNDFYVTMNMDYIVEDETININETRKEFVKYQD
ncbi:MAG: hypothetical protein C0601_06915 [Candidatus Muiribacterium halophilum]|uniref:Uncharacterized protein n=1 Tax=Muiribacterium halophilum TaxID=2053465 RepID=A0A2N5ZGI7_MUIH1|nr:MAG: hypothetical protein C0601_06915 [Candidatus Muirbacterium halophilum]